MLGVDYGLKGLESQTVTMMGMPHWTHVQNMIIKLQKNYRLLLFNIMKDGRVKCKTEYYRV